MQFILSDVFIIQKSFEVLVGRSSDVSDGNFAESQVRGSGEYRTSGRARPEPLFLALRTEPVLDVVECHRSRRHASDRRDRIADPCTLNA